MQSTTLTGEELRALLAEEDRKPRSKYHSLRCNQPDKAGDCWPECGKHDSHAEHMRWAELVQLERAGQIRNLREKVTFELAPAVMDGGRKRPALRYESDFVYEEYKRVEALTMGGMYWLPVVEDCKGKRTEAYRLKRHLMLSVHGIEIRETGGRR